LLLDNGPEMLYFGRETPIAGLFEPGYLCVGGDGAAQCGKIHAA
jgi:hypothetical protein